MWVPPVTAPCWLITSWAWLQNYSGMALWVPYAMKISQWHGALHYAWAARARSLGDGTRRDGARGASVRGANPAGRGGCVFALMRCAAGLWLRARWKCWAWVSWFSGPDDPVKSSRVTRSKQASRCGIAGGRRNGPGGRRGAGGGAAKAGIGGVSPPRPAKAKAARGAARQSGGAFNLRRGAWVETLPAGNQWLPPGSCFLGVKWRAGQRLCGVRGRS
jgi:hypothetical protein